MRRVTKWLRFAILILVPSLTTHGRSARADDNPVVGKGIAFLRSQVSSSKVGESALIALALLKAEVPPTDAAVTSCIGRIRSRLSSGSYTPELSSGGGIYEAAVCILALANLDPEASRGDISGIVQYLLSKQNPNGSWDYSGRQNGDTSISQYAVLGLWEAENAGIVVPPSVWDSSAQFFLSVQGPLGSWNYHRDESATYRETIAMTAAGTGSLLICQRQLAKYRKGNEAVSGLLTMLAPEQKLDKYQSKIAPSRIESAWRQGASWLATNFTTVSNEIIGPTAFYALYGIERIGALADKATLGKVNWFDQGKAFIESKQQANGSWNSTHGTVPNTVWAVLFLTKSTAKTMRKIEIKRLGAGTLLGGRGLPKDLTNITVAGGKVVSVPMNGAIDGMLSVLEDPRSENADSALAGLVTRFRNEGPKALRPHKDRFRKLIRDRDPGVRRVAAWSLARTDDLDVAPNLIDALTDPDEAVVGVAREGMQLLSRKIDGYGPASPSTPEQRLQASKAWREWYNNIRPLQVDSQDTLDPSRASK